MTTRVPQARANGKSRSGRRVSEATKVTDAQASAENRLPTIAAPKAASAPMEKTLPPSN